MATITAAAGGGAWQTNGTWVGGVKPTAADDVLLTVTSGAITIDSGAVCRSLDCTGYVSTLTHNSAVTLTIGDATAGTGNNALKFVSGMTYTLGNNATSAISFVSTSATQQTVTFGTQAPGNLTFNGAGGSWIFNDGFTNTVCQLILVQGTLNTNGQTLSVDRVSDFGHVGSRSLTLGASSITGNGTGGNPWSLAASGLTFNAGTSTITLAGGSEGFVGAGQTYNNVVISGAGGSTISDANTFANLTRTGTTTKTCALSISANQTITGTLTINGNSATNRVLIQSSTVGTSHTLTAATVVVTNADFMDITGAGAGSWNLAAITGNSGDCGGNSGITFTTTATQTHTTSAGGNWSDVSKWTSRVPLPQDNVIVDANTTGTLTADMPRLGKDLTFTGFAGTAVFSSTANSVFGSLTLASGMTVSGTQTLTLAGRGSHTLTSAGKSFAQQVTQNGPSSTYTLQDNCSVLSNLRVTNGTLTANGFDLTIGGSFIFDSGGTVNLGAGTWDLTGTGAGTAYWLANGGTVNSSTSTIVFASATSNSRTFTGGGNTYNNLQYDVAGSTGELIIQQNNTFANLTVGSGRTLTLPASTTTTITGSFAVNGTNGSTTTLQSSSAGTAATLSKASGTVTVDWLSIKDSTATGGATFRALDSTSVSGNTGWTFIPTSGDLSLTPISDVAINTWTTDSGGTTSLFAAIDETTASDADYVQSPVAPTTASYYETALENHADPLSSSGHITHYRYEKNVATGAVDLTVSLRQGASTEIASWAHTGISNSWTQQDQTLTSGQADSITDYSDLRLRFVPNMTTSDAVPTYVADRATANSNSTVTTVDLVLASLTVGNYLIIRSAADNSGGGGAARSFTPSNQSGTAMGTHSEYQQNEDPGAASAGTTLNVSVIKIAATSGTIRLTYSGAVVQACVAEEWSGIDGTTPVVGTPQSGTQNASGTLLASATDASIAAGNVVYGVVAVEGPSSDTYTQDSDTTNGSWSTLTKLGTSNATATDNQTTYAGYKAVTAAGAQTYNPTINNAADSAGLIIELAAAATTIRTQVSWANLELPTSTPTPSMPPLPFNRRTFRTLVVR